MTKKETEEEETKKIEELDWYINYKFQHQKNIYWGVSKFGIFITFTNFFQLPNVESFFENIKKIYKPVVRIQTKRYDGKVVMVFRFAGTSASLGMNPFKDELFVKNPEDLKKIKQKKEIQLMQSKKRFLQKIKKMKQNRTKGFNQISEAVITNLQNDLQNDFLENKNIGE